MSLDTPSLTTPTGAGLAKPGLLTPSFAYKPFRYPWAYDFWKRQQQVHWMPEEVPLADDVKDWRNKLTDSERHLLTQIFRFFTQADVEVNNCYMKHYSQVFQPTEVKMMLAAFSNMETVHIAAYSHLLDTIGMPESEYSAFLQYKEMKDKHDYLSTFGVDTDEDIARTLQDTIWPMPFILLKRGKFIRIANEAKSCSPSVKAPNTARVSAISSRDSTLKFCM